ncbi:MAG: GNAT family N-acetyltransferase [Opitutae bacterium]|nr:GNAT family N-acetyltransferase [Opitutae bacterium]
MHAPPIAAAPVRVLPWDSAFFGFRIGCVTSSRLTPELLEATLAAGETERLRCLYFAADVGCKASSALARQGGFELIEQRIDLARPAPSAARELPTGFRAAVKEDLPTFTALAREAHTGTRFFKDARFPRARAADLYATWIERDFREHELFALGMGKQCEPVGYVSVQRDCAKGIGRIGLIAVAPRLRGHGCGHRLVQGAVSRCAELGCREIRVTTHSVNATALNLYRAEGFRPIEVRSMFHRWF